MIHLSRTFIFVLSAFAWFSFGATHASAQVVLPEGSLYVLDEGTGGQKGSLGIIEYPCREYSVVDSIGSFGTSLFALGDTLFVNEGSGQFSNGAGNVYVLDMTTNTFLDTISSVAARQMARWQDKLLAVCDQPPFFKVIDLNTLNVTDSLAQTKVGNEAGGIVVTGDTAWITVNGFNGFGLNGVADTTVIPVDLVAMDTLATLEVAVNPGSIVAGPGNVYVKSGISFGAPGVVVTRINRQTFSTSRVDTLPFDPGAGFHHLDGAMQIQWQATDTNGVEQIVSYDITSGQTSTDSLGESVYAFQYIDAFNGYVASQTDFNTQGYVRQLISGVGGYSLLDSMQAGISPRSFAFHQRPVFLPAVGLDYANINGDTLLSTSAADSARFFITNQSGVDEVSWVVNAANDTLSLSADTAAVALFGNQGALELVYTLRRNGCETTDTVTYFIQVITNREDAIGAAAINVYPNPVSADLHIDLPTNDPEATFRLLTPAGQLVRRGSLSGPTISVRELPAGLYIGTVETHERLYRFRFMQR